LSRPIQTKIRASGKRGHLRLKWLRTEPMSDRADPSKHIRRRGATAPSAVTFRHPKQRPPFIVKVAKRSPGFGDLPPSIGVHASITPLELRLVLQCGRRISTPNAMQRFRDTGNLA
jgi:hypothetical protein